MTDKLLESLIDHSSQVEEQRADNKRHLLLYIIIAICAVICDANEWTDIRQEGDIHGERLGFGQWASARPEESGWRIQ